MNRRQMLTVMSAACAAALAPVRAFAAWAENAYANTFTHLPKGEIVIRCADDNTYIVHEGEKLKFPKGTLYSRSKGIHHSVP